MKKLIAAALLGLVSLATFSTSAQAETVVVSHRHHRHAMMHPRMHHRMHHHHAA